MYKFVRKALIVIVFLVFAFRCSGPGTKQPAISANHPIHLEEYVAQAKIKRSEVPKKFVDSVEWHFDKAQPDWKPIVPLRKSAKSVQTVQMADALRLILEDDVKSPWSNMTHYSGGIWVDLPDWHREDWAYIVVNARARCEGGSLTLVGQLNNRENVGGRESPLFVDSTESVNIIGDGHVHSYIVRADWSPGEYSGYKRWHDPWTQLRLQFGGDKRATIEILSVSVIPKEVKYARAPIGVDTEVRGTAYRRVLFMHTPSSIAYRLRVPDAGRLDVGLGVLRDNPPVNFRVTVKAGRRAREILFEEEFADKTGWGQRSMDLSRLAGKTVELVLEAECEHEGAVALWAAPTLSGAGAGSQPNVILYIIDGAAADQMSVYGYNRRTTPRLERLAAEGAVFEHAYSNSSWTKISAPSFMTSLHCSVLGPYQNPSDRIPRQAVTMAEHMHRAGYQTAVFVSNPHAGTMSGLERGVDVLREAGVEPNSKSSQRLQADFWKWRSEYPGEPYWAHIQPTDVHIPWTQYAPFAGLFVDPDSQKIYEEWFKKIGETEGRLYERFSKAGIDPARFTYLARGLYDETMANQDDQIGRFVKRLKAEGEWGHTIFIVAADHSSSAAGIIPLDPRPAEWGQTNLASEVSHIPMILIWPGRIKPGQRFEQPISLVDLLPTILDLAGLPQPDTAQGQSFASLILGKKGWEQRPVILDEFSVRPDTGGLYGTIDVIDGRWGASLKVGKAPWEDNERPEYLRPAPLLLYDLWNDPQCLRSLHEGRPALVKKYTKFLEDKLKEHQTLAKKFSRPAEVPLNPEQIKTLRSLGYIK
ncbi:MAG: sulfatase-like hydrolase/transferase [Candidatus Aminicenantes bacterium]|nr:sulfatase-like hydrolase/transferase [Candidatus Aminicenantes bacterium]